MPKRDTSSSAGTDGALLERALDRASGRDRAQRDTAPHDVDPREQVFPGNMPPPESAAPSVRPTRSRRRTRRKVSPFTVVVALLLTAIASVLYISNVLAVSRLAAEVGDLEKEYQTVLDEQEMVRAQIARLSGLERIRRIAEEEYNMQYPEAVPGWLTVDPERVNELQRLADAAGARGENDGRQ